MFGDACCLGIGEDRSRPGRILASSGRSAQSGSTGGTTPPVGENPSRTGLADLRRLAPRPSEQVKWDWSFPLT